MRGLALSPAARGLDDDAAVLECGGETLVLTHDAMVEGVHFPIGHDRADVAWKLVATNLSDLAGKGAMPLGVLLSYELGADDAGFAKGLAEVLNAYDVPLLGGDTVRGPVPHRYGLTAIGRATHTPVPARSGAQIGDRIYVTGEIGAAMLGFEQLDSGGIHREAYTRPKPLLAEGCALAPYARAMMDISDGLLLDLFRLANASGVCASLQSNDVPVADDARRDACMRWGDDYQLLFTLPAHQNPPIKAHCIGEITPGGTAPLILDGCAQHDAATLGYQH